jgi:hypothetical protein
MSDYTAFFNSLMSFSVCLLKPTPIIYMYYILKKNNNVILNLEGLISVKVKA